MTESTKKYPALKKGSNTKARRSAIEVDYVDGVYDENGKQVIRPLNEEEKEWLNQFYEETVRTNFLHGKGMRDKNKQINEILKCDEYKKLIEEQKNALTFQEKKRLKEIKSLLKEQNRDDNEEEISALEEELQTLRDKYLFYSNPEDHRQFYTENNKRNNDVLNKVFLEEYRPEIMDDIFLSNLDILDFEDLLIQMIEGDDE